MAGKQKLAVAIKDSSDLSLIEASNAVEVTVKAIHAMTKAGKTVKLRGFGTFRVVERKACVGRNLHTGERVEIAAHKTLAFKASK